jgi:hypothetical protein
MRFPTEEDLPISGYVPQSEENIKSVNFNKDIEETVLRLLDGYEKDLNVDQRWLTIARTNIEQGFMAMNRAVMKPNRVKFGYDDVESKEK